jgi:hypothetical protein
LRRFATAVTVGLAGTAAMAGTAHAQAISITPAKACYLTRDTVSLSGSGFTPGGPVDVSIDGTSLGQTAADAAGNIAGEIRLGTMRGVKSHAMTATDQTNPALIASVSYLGTSNRVTVRPQNARAGTKRRLRGSGFVAGPRVYMHVRGPRGYRSDKRIARAKAPCGTFAVRRRIVGSGASVGRYRVQFDAVRRYSKKTRPRLVGFMNVSLRAGSARAGAALFGGATLAQRWTTFAG